MLWQEYRIALVAIAVFSNVAIAQKSSQTSGKQVITNTVGMKLVLIPAGEFMMGSRESAKDIAALFDKTYGEDLLRWDSFNIDRPRGHWPLGIYTRREDFFENEQPQHRVRITKAFYLGTCPITRGQFRLFVNDSGYKTDAESDSLPGAWGLNADKGRHFSKDYSWRNVGFQQTDEHPVVDVSWHDAMAFCQWLSRTEGAEYRLPTEAQWEYACRAGTTTRYYCGDDPELLAKVGNVADGALKNVMFRTGWKGAIEASDGYAFTAPVGQFKPNAFGLYDMHGNVWEWCSDWHDGHAAATSHNWDGASYYRKAPIDDPSGPDGGDNRVLRGGAWDFGPEFARSACRSWGLPDHQRFVAGFRVVRVAESRH
jgi:formylglycine-generating enzyme required for sulfatase activity